MSHDNGCPSGPGLVQGRLNDRLALGVQGRGGFVEEQNLRVSNEGPRDGDALLLSAGQLSAAFADQGVVFLKFKLKHFRTFKFQIV